MCLIVQSYNVRIDTRVKGQGVYFLITSNINKDEVVILTRGTKAITFRSVKIHVSNIINYVYVYT